MAYIAQWLNEQLQAKTADLIVEDTLADLKRRSGMLDAYMPIKTYTGRKFLSYVVREINVIASVIAYGGEVPNARTGSFEKITAEMLKTGLSYTFTEEEQWDMMEAMELAAARGISVQSYMDENGVMIEGAANDLASHIFGTIERAVKAQMDKLEALTWQALTTGEINDTDPRTNMTLSFDYKKAGANYNHFPTALTGATAWDQYASAEGIQDIYNLVSDFVDTNGFKPDCIAMSWKLRNDLMQQASTKQSASSLTVTQVGQVSPNMLDALLEARQLPMIKTFDEQYEVEDVSGSDSLKVRFLPADRFVLLTENMGQRAIGTTLEGGAEPGSGRSGVYVTAREIQKVPPIDAIQTTMTSIPVLANPKLLGGLKCK